MYWHINTLHSEWVKRTWPKVFVSKIIRILLKLLVCIYMSHVFSLNTLNRYTQNQYINSFDLLVYEHWGV